MAIGVASVNKAIVLGNLGQDPELKYTTSGSAVTTLSLATKETWKDSEGNKQERTEWHRIVLWRKLAEIAGEYMKKGSKVYIEGRLQTRSWEDKDGIKRYSTEIVGDVVTMLDSRGSSRPPQPPDPTEKEIPAPPTASLDEEDDLPF